MCAADFGECRHASRCGVRKPGTGRAAESGPPTPVAGSQQLSQSIPARLSQPVYTTRCLILTRPGHSDADATEGGVSAQSRAAMFDLQNPIAIQVTERCCKHLVLARAYTAAAMKGASMPALPAFLRNADGGANRRMEWNLRWSCVIGSLEIV